MTKAELLTLPDLYIVALTIWGEARGEPVEGQIAVGNVIRNRVKLASGTRRYAEVCLAPHQFSCWNDTDANRPKLDLYAHLLTTATAPIGELQQALWIAGGVLSGAVKDNTGGALNYLTAGLLASEHAPSWAVGKPLRHIGDHVFLKA